jgi:hypothetical protein
MSPSHILNEIINAIEPEEVPVEYIIMARVTDFDGNERIIRGAEIETLLSARADDPRIADARIILNVRKIKKAILDEVNRIYDEVNRSLLRGS